MLMLVTSRFGIVDVADVEVPTKMAAVLVAVVRTMQPGSAGPQLGFNVSPGANAAKALEGAAARNNAMRKRNLVRCILHRE